MNDSYKRFAFSILPLTALFLFVFSLAANAQENKNVEWKLLTPTLSGKAGTTVTVKLQAKIAAGSHMYSLKKYSNPDNSPSSTEITVGEKAMFSLAGTPQIAHLTRHVDPNFDSLETEYVEGTTTITVPIKIAKNTAAGQQQGWVNVYFATCTDRSCLPPTDKKIAFSVLVSADSSTTAKVGPDTTGKIDTAAMTAVAKPDSPAATAPPSKAVVTSASPSMTPVGSDKDIADAKKKGLGSFLILAALTGLISLATPCVYPMVPITVSFFTKRSQTTKMKSLRDASLYSLGIISTFSLIGFLTSVIFGASAIGEFAAHPVVNIAIFVIFVALALNLFGMYEIQLPTGLLNRLNRKAQQEGDSITGVMLMGVVFSITSFTCTGAFVASLLKAASGGDWLWPLMGMLVFSTVFAAPFFLLALFPAALKSMPKSGGWLNAVKVVMGFLELAFAVKFLSNADLIWQWGIFTREAFLAIWIAIAVLVTIYLLGKFHLPHDSPVDKVGPVRVVFAVSFLSIGFWLLTGLFGGRLGDLEAMVPPQEYPGKGNTSPLAMTQVSSNSGSGNSSPTVENGGWLLDDYGKALVLAKQTGKPIFIDFTGYTCTNCRWMERNMFSRPEVMQEMKKYILVRLYTDRRDSINMLNRGIEEKRFNTIALPYYALVTPADSVISTIAYTTKPEEFLDFLSKGVKQVALAPSGQTVGG